MSRHFPKTIQELLLRSFANHYGIDLDAAEKSIGEYKSLQDFFTRRLKPGMRPQEQMVPGAINCPVDGQIIAHGRIQEGTLIQAKGMPYGLAELLKYIPSAERFENGHFITLYLSPKDYHRIHVPIEGMVQAVSRVEGELWPVNNVSTAHVPKLYERNRRATWLAEGSGQNHGLLVACVLVGATHVGGCIIDDRWLNGNKLPKNAGFAIDNLPCNPGEELGVFQFGSTVILLIGGERADNWKPTKSEGIVKVGQRIGEFR